MSLDIHRRSPGRELHIFPDSRMIDSVKAQSSAEKDLRSVEICGAGRWGAAGAGAPYAIARTAIASPRNRGSA